MSIIRSCQEEAQAGLGGNLSWQTAPTAKPGSLRDAIFWAAETRTVACRCEEGIRRVICCSGFSGTEDIEEGEGG